MAAPAPATARRYAAASAALSVQAASASRRESDRSSLRVAAIVAAYQSIAARVAGASIGLILGEQDVSAAADGALNPAAFTTVPEIYAEMAATITARQQELERQLDTATAAAKIDAEFDRLVASLVQDAARSADSVSVTARPDIAHVRLLTPPSCSRCVVLAGRVYRWSTGFLRHPGCDCVMLPVTVGSDQYVQDPIGLAEQGQVTGLSKADLAALLDGGDLNQIVNVRRQAAGLQQSGRVLARAGRLTPEGIYQVAETREQAVEMLTANGYLI